MTTVTCPNCDAPLSPEDIAGGWCERCGKSIPVHVLSAAARASRKSRPAQPLQAAGALADAGEARLVTGALQVLSLAVNGLAGGAVGAGCGLAVVAPVVLAVAVFVGLFRWVVGGAAFSGAWWTAVCLLWPFGLAATLAVACFAAVRALVHTRRLQAAEDDDSASLVCPEVVGDLFALATWDRARFAAGPGRDRWAVRLQVVAALAVGVGALLLLR